MSETDTYIWSRLQADAAHAIALAECEEAIPHSGLRGRLREILIGNLLSPWLPPFCKCVTGMIIEASNKDRRNTQEDILVIDTTLAPPVLANPSGPEGVFPFNSVLLRIEVKTTITSDGIKDFLKASLEVSKMNFTRAPDCHVNFVKPYNILVAFRTDLIGEDTNTELDRLVKGLHEEGLSPLQGRVSALCVVNRGYWYLRGFEDNKRGWLRFTEADPQKAREQRLAAFLCHASNHAFRDHAIKQGLDPLKGLAAGVGFSVPDWVSMLIQYDERGQRISLD